MMIEVRIVKAATATPRRVSQLPQSILTDFLHDGLTLSRWKPSAL